MEIRELKLTNYIERIIFLCNKKSKPGIFICGIQFTCVVYDGYKCKQT